MELNLDEIAKIYYPYIIGASLKCANRSYGFGNSLKVLETKNNKKYWPLLDKINKRTDELLKDPKFIEEGEELHRKLSYISPEDLLRPFTI